MDRELPVPDDDNLYGQLCNLVDTLGDSYPGTIGGDDISDVVDDTLDQWMNESRQYHGTIDDQMAWEVRMGLREEEDEDGGSTSENLWSHVPYLGSFCSTRDDFQDLEEVIGQPITTVVIRLGERLEPMNLSLHSPEMKFRSVDGLIQIHPDSFKNWLLVVHGDESYRCVINRS